MSRRKLKFESKSLDGSEHATEYFVCPMCLALAVERTCDGEQMCGNCNCTRECAEHIVCNLSDDEYSKYVDGVVFMVSKKRNQTVKFVPVDCTEEFIMNEKFPLKGWRRWRIEYGGCNEECLAEGIIYLPASTANPDAICQLIMGMQMESTMYDYTGDDIFKGNGD